MEKFEYIARKIHQCIELVENATSDAQKAVYEGYLKIWQDKAKNIPIHPKKPKEIPKKIPEKTPEEAPDEIEIPIPEITIDEIVDEAEGLVNTSEPLYEAPTEPEEVIVEYDDKSINEYEEDTGRKAIWKGVITNGFKEFLISKE